MRKKNCAVRSRILCAAVAVLFLLTACGGNRAPAASDAAAASETTSAGDVISASDAALTTEETFVESAEEAVSAGEAGSAADGAAPTAEEASAESAQDAASVEDGTSTGNAIFADGAALATEKASAENVEGADSADEAAADEAALAREAEHILERMSMEEKIAQMIIPAIRTWDGQNVTYLDQAPALAEALRRHQYGGIILFGENIAGSGQVAKLVADLQENNRQIEDISAPIPYFMAVDEEGGIVTRFGTGTRMTGNMAIGATGDNAEDNALATGRIIGEEMAALGFNVDFAPVVDVNNNPANPVIGTRSFSDDPQAVAALGEAFSRGLAQNHIIATYKHFPGHGDTTADSHIGTPSVDKTYEELRENELVPFASAIRNGAEMIMTAHITYPAIDEEQNFGDGATKGFYPATMSGKMITEVLRGDMGYDGVVVTDAMEMDAIDEAGLVPGARGSLEYRVNVAEKVINAGVDILLIPTDLNSGEKADLYDRYITALADRAGDGRIPEPRIDESVGRILRLKLKYGILAPAEGQKTVPENSEHAGSGEAGAGADNKKGADGSGTAGAGADTKADADGSGTAGAGADTKAGADGSGTAGAGADAKTDVSTASANSAAEETGAAASQVTAQDTSAPSLESVGSDAHHLREMEIARQAVTVVKNDAQTLPVAAAGKKIVLLGRQESDIPALHYYVRLLQEEGALEADAQITIETYLNGAGEEAVLRYTDGIRQAIREADLVVGMTRTYSLDALTADAPQYEGIHRAIEDTHAGDGRFVLLSQNLPYDAARFQEADAIVLTYNGSGIMDPTDDGTAGRQLAGNANVPAALETVFGFNAPSGRLPVNIPVIEEQADGTLSYGRDLLYERGFGLVYD